MDVKAACFVAVAVVLGRWAAADPSVSVQTRIVREYEENGQSKVQEMNPSLHLSGDELRVGDQTLSAPRLPDETTQKVFSTFAQLFATQAGPMLSRWNTSGGKPLELRLEIPNLGEKLTIQVTPQVEP